MRFVNAALLCGAGLLMIMSAAATATAAEPFVPAGFKVPVTYQGKGYKLVPLGPDLVKVDYDAYMSSIDHLQKSFSNGKWPHAGITMQDAMKDLEEEKARFEKRESFAYGVLTADGKKELGSFYVRPSNKQGYDAVATFWVTKEQLDKGFETTLFRDMKKWMASKWPFQKVAWPKREIPQAEWAALPAKAK